MGIDSEDQILLTNFGESNDDEYCQRFMAFLDHDSKNVVLAIRGTKSVDDVLTDLICDNAPFLSGEAHRGILKGAKRVLEKVEPIIRRECARRPDYG